MLTAFIAGIQARIQDFLKCRALLPQMITATQRGLRNRGGRALGEEVITPLPMVHQLATERFLAFHVPQILRYFFIL
jgi:hypothetical protein